jgi:two-component system nitrogen regulation sensor histidine kinase GlnL
MPDNIEHYYTSIIESIPEGLLVLSNDLIITTINSAMVELLGSSESHTLNCPINQIFPEKDTPVIPLIKKSLTDGTTHSIHDYTHFRIMDSASIPVTISISPLRGEQGITSGIILIMRDVKRLKELEYNVLRKEKLINAENIAVSMAHEIKNPLGGITGAAQLLFEEISEKKHKEYLEVIVKECNRVNSIVEALLDITRIKPTESVNLNIHRLLDDIIQLQEKEAVEKNIKIIKNYDPSLPPIKGDEHQLVQVFLNLIKNGIESIKNEGELSITTKVSYDFSIIRGKGKKSQIGLIEIADTGAGISKENQKKIFTPFFSSKYKGNGLGLAISHAIVEKHNGRISLENKKNRKGAVAKVFLPLSRT